MEIIVNEKKDEKFDKKRILSLLKNKHLIILILILTLAFGLRINYYNVNEAVWWDSADYLTGAKVIYNPDLEERLSNYNLNPRRPFFLSLFWGALLYFGGNDTTLHFSVLVFSMLGVWLTYLIGRDMYNKNVGLIAAFLMAVSWTYLFHTARLLTDVIALTFWLMTVFFFWKGYVKKESGKWLWLAGISMGLGIFTRAASLINLIPLFILILAKDNMKFVKNKNIWVFLILILLVMSPFFIWLAVSFDDPLYRFTGIGSSSTGEAPSIGRFRIAPLRFFEQLYFFPFMVLTPMLMERLGSPNIVGLLIILLILGLCLDLFLGLDLVFKRKDENLLKKLFLLVWILTPYTFYSVFPGGGIEDRYLFAMLPAIFILFGVGMMGIGALFRESKYKKVISLIIIIVILGVLSIPQLMYAGPAIMSKSKSYAEIRYAGEWIKSNSLSGDRVVSASKYQNLYYSERDTFGFEQEEEKFEDYLKVLNPRYVIISVYEPGFTPDWVLDYPTKHPELLRPVQGYFADESQAQPILIIFEYSGYFEQYSDVNQSS